MQNVYVRPCIIYHRGKSIYLWGTWCKMYVRSWIYSSEVFPVTSEVHHAKCLWGPGFLPLYLRAIYFFSHLLPIYMHVWSFCIICLFFPLVLLCKMYVVSYLLPTRYLFFHDFTILLCQFKSGFYNHILTILTTGDQDLSFTVVLHQTSKHDTLSSVF